MNNPGIIVITLFYSNKGRIGKISPKLTDQG